MIPFPMGMASSLFANNAKKCRDLGKQLELPTTIFCWWLAIEISFLPPMKNHYLSGNSAIRPWEVVVNKIIVAFSREEPIVAPPAEQPVAARHSSILWHQGFR